MSTINNNGVMPMSADELYDRLVEEKQAFNRWLNAGGSASYTKFERKYPLTLHFRREFSDGMADIINEEYQGNYDYAKPSKYSKQRTALIRKIRNDWKTNLPEYTFETTQSIIDTIKFYWQKRYDAAMLAKKK
jgi:hypothetical protein